MTEYRTTTVSSSDAEIEHLGEGLLACTLERAGLDPRGASRLRRPISCFERPDIDLDGELAGHHPPLQRERRRREQRHRGLSRDDHPTASCTAFASSSTMPDAREPLHELVNELLLSPMGRRDWPLRFYSRERLFSVEARLTRVEPDLEADCHASGTVIRGSVKMLQGV